MEKNYSRLPLKRKLIKTVSSLLFFVFFTNYQNAKAQCISVFPHTENFETAATWTAHLGPSSAVASDWAWGTPSKAVITGAGGGNKCWITGGLNGTEYGCGEQSYIQSPCYNLASLSYPFVSLKVFWETEYKFDGAKLQSSIDGGTTWVSVGASTDNDCMTTNWYNDATVKYLNSPAWVTPTDGWAGNAQSSGGGGGTCGGSGCSFGNGSSGWLTATHCLTGLAGKTNVIFRIVFAAGTTCNSFDGFAIDDFTVEEGTANAPTYSYSCTGAHKLAFTSINPACPTPTTYSWDFGDPTSGASNTSASANPSHVFSTVGTYTVSLTTSGGPCNPPGTYTQSIVVSTTPSITITPSSVSVCQGQTATLTASSSATSYTWMPGSLTTSTISVSSSGSYSVTGSNICGSSTASQSITVNALPTLTLTASSTTLCSSSSATLSVTGSANNTYSWTSSAGGGLSATTGTLVTINPTSTPVTYSVIATNTVTNCQSVYKTTTVTVTTAPTVTLSSSSYTTCLNVPIVFGASGASTYTWTPTTGMTGSTTSSPTVTPTATTTTVYSVTGTSSGCTSAANTVTLTVNPLPTLTITALPTPSVCLGSAVSFTASGANTYTWTSSGNGGLATTTGSTVSATPNTTANATYTINATDGNGCKNNSTYTINVNALPTLTLTASSATLCSSSNATLSVTGSANNTYSWTSSAGGALSATTGTLVTASPTSTPVTYSVIATNTVTNCQSVYKTTTLTVTTTPTVSPTQATYTTCLNVPIVFGASGASTYTWTPTTGMTGSTTSSPTVTPTATTTTVYSVTGTSSGCTSAANTVTLTVNPLPTLTITALPTPSVCLGSAVSFTASGANTYTWTSSGNGGLATTTGSTVSATPNTTANATYTINATDGNGCKNNSTYTINVNALPTLTLTASSATLCSSSNATLSVTGSANNTYAWTSSAGGGLSATTGTLVTASPTSSPATYSVVATNTVTGCVSVVKTTTLTVSTTPTVSPTQATYTTCLNVPIVFGASGASTYTWSPTTGMTGSTTSSPTVTPTSTTTTVYSVIGTTSGCASTANTVTLTVNPLPTLTVTPSTTVICSGAGSSTLTASGANTYVWTPGATLSATTGSVVVATPTNIAAATVYTVTGTDGNGCVNKNTVSVKVNSTPTISIVGGGGNSQTVCGGGVTNATVTAITFTSNPSGSVSWTNSNTGIGVAASGTTNIGAYTAPTVTAQTVGIITASSTVAGCTSTSSTQLNYTVTINQTPGETGETINAAGCGLNDGTITGATGTGGSGNYSYQWNNTGGFVATSPYTNGAGTYPLQIKDNVTGCVYQQNFTIPNAGAPSPPTITPSATAACVGGTVVLTANPPAPGGTTYNWSQSNNTNPGTGDTYTITNLPASPNPYIVNVTATASSCTGTSYTLGIVVNPLPSPTINSSTSQICQGSSTTLSVSPTGAYTYQWGNSSGTIAGATGSTLSVNASSTYSVTVINSVTTCSASTSANGTILVNALPTIDTTGFTLIQTNCTTPTGGATNIALTGAATITYTWTSGTALPTGTAVATGSGNSASLANAPAGVYCLNITDGNACQNNFCSITVTNAGAPVQPVLTLAGNDTTYCQGDPMQTLTVTVANSGTVTPTINWYSDAGLNTTLATNTNVYTPSAALPVGTTTIYVAATSNGCTSTGRPITITINPTPTPPTLTAPTGTNNSYCEGSPVPLVVNSGTNTAVWYSNNTVVYTGTSFTPPTATYPAGTYTFSVIDSIAVSGGCVNASQLANTVTLTLVVNPTPPVPTFTGSTTANNSYCQGSPVPLTVNSGTTIAVWYSNNTVVNVGSTFNPPANLAAGTYTYSVIDSVAVINGCINAPQSLNTTTLTLVVNPLPVAPILTAPTGTNNSYCAGSPVPLTVNSGTATAVWYTGNTVINVGSTYNPPVNLAAGTYTYSVIDSVAVVNGCINAPQSSNTTTLTLVVNPLPVAPILTAPTGTNNSYCQGSPVPLTVNSGTATAVWYSGNIVVNVGSIFNPPINLAAGTYTYSIIDSVAVVNGCINAPQSSNTTTLTLVVNPLPVAPILTAPTGTNNSYCQGSPVPLTVNSGTATAVWYSGNTVINVGSTFNPPANLAAGTYTYSVIDSVAVVNGCINAPQSSNTTTLTLVVNPLPVAPILTAPTGTNNSYCQGSPVPLTVNSGTATAVWYTGNTVINVGSTFNPPVNLAAGTYTYSIIDSVAVVNGCINAPQASNTTTLTLVVNPLPVAPILTAPTGTNNSYCQGSPVPLTVNSGTATAVWYTGNTVINVGSIFNPPINLAAGTYTYSVIDSVAVINGCINAPQASNTTTLTLVVNSLPTAPIFTGTTSSNNSYCAGHAVPLTVSTGTNMAVWYSGNTVVYIGSSFTPPAATYPGGTYTFSVIDSIPAVNGCVNAPGSTNTTTLTLVVNPTPTLNVSGTSLDSAKCGQSNGGVNGLTNSSVSGGTSPYAFQWTNLSTGAIASTLPVLSNQLLGTYSLQVTDANNCIATISGGSSTFTVPASAAIHAQATTNPSPATGSVPLAISFSNTSVGASNYVWIFGDGNTSTLASPTNTYTNVGTYNVILAAINGTCSDTFKLTVIANIPTTIIVPNVFTPNGDGVNDEFFIINTGMVTLNCDIFNRWGQLLFTITAPNQSWDGITPNGDKAPDGTYMYLFQAQGLDGKAYKQQGTLMLVR